MDVSEHLDRSRDFNENWLLLEQDGSPDDQELDLLLGQDLLLDDLVVVSNLVFLQLLKPSNDLIKLL